MSIKNKVTGDLSNITTYTADGDITDITVPGNLSAGGNVVATGNINGGGMTIVGDAVITGDANVQGTLTYNDITSITTDNLVIGLGNNQTGINVTGSGIVVGNTNEATWRYNQPARSWDSNIAISAAGNISGSYIIGDGSLLSNISGANISDGYGDSNVESLLSGGTVNSNLITTANISGSYVLGNGSQLTGLPAGYANSNASAYFSSGSASADIVTTANISGSYVLGNGSQLTGLPAEYSNVNVRAYLSSGAADANIITTANISGSYILGDGSLLTGLPAGYSNANASAYMSSGINSGGLRSSGTVSAAQLSSTGGVYSTGEIITGNIANASSPKMRMVTDNNYGYIQMGTGTPGSTGTLAFSPYSSGDRKATVNTGTGDISTAGTIRAADMYNSSGKLLAASVSSPSAGQVLTYNGSQWVNSASQNNTVNGSVIIPPGINTVSFTIPNSGTYVANFTANIPNGIFVWNATITLTNTNVPVIGTQYGWNYSGWAVRILELPKQIVGVAGGFYIGDSPAGMTIPTNVFYFQIQNNSGWNQVGYWGYTKLS